MYWSKQEQVVFDIILFILVVFQVSTVMLNIGEITFLNGAILVGVNLILLAPMVPYAKWVWKSTSYRKAALQVVKHELIILALGAIAILLSIITLKMKGRI